MRQHQSNGFESIMETVMATGSDDMGAVFGRLFNMAMQVERERFLNAQAYERTEGRRGYANGFKPKKLDTVVGTVDLDIPKRVQRRPSAVIGERPTLNSSGDGGHR
jgi:transposase-like protein